MCTLTSLAPLLYFPSFVIHLPTKHVGVLKKLLWTCPCVPDRIGIWKCCFLRRGSDNQSIWKNLSEKRTNNKLNPHMASTRGFTPGPRWWEPCWLSPLRQPCPIWFLRYYVAFVWDSPEARIFSKVLKSGGSLYFVAFSGVLLLGTLFIHSPLSGIQNPTWTVNLYLLLHYVYCT